MHTLILSNCPQVNQPNFLDRICKTAPNLIDLRLENFECEDLEFSFPSFRNTSSSLGHVILKNCKIMNVIANSSNLFYFKMINCSKLLSLTIWSNMEKTKREMKIKNQHVSFDLEYFLSKATPERILQQDKSIFLPGIMMTC
jgi:hypothetical protein